jgi:hypothetical protein
MLTQTNFFFLGKKEKEEKHAFGLLVRSSDRPSTILNICATERKERKWLLITIKSNNKLERDLLSELLKSSPA